MKKSVIIWIAVGVLLLIFCGVGCSKYNGMVTSRNAVDQKWGDLQSQYETRATLIPQLVATVQGAASHESGTLEKVTNARAGVDRVAGQLKNFDLNDMSDEARAQYIQAQEELQRKAQIYVNAVAEAYPTITATDAFKKLQDQVEGQYNRVNTLRKDYNKSITDYNNTIQTFPNNLFASLFGFQSKKVYSAPAGSETVPQISF